MGGFGSCPGDSGGPLMRFDVASDPPRYVQVGVVHGAVRRCGDRRFPGIYARLEDPDVMAFIRREISGTRKYILATKPL